MFKAEDIKNDDVSDFSELCASPQEIIDKFNIIFQEFEIQENRDSLFSNPLELSLKNNKLTQLELYDIGLQADPSYRAGEKRGRIDVYKRQLLGNV